MEWLEALWRMVVENWEWIMAVAIPFLVAAIAKCNWSSDAKGWLAVGISLVVGVVAAFAQGLVLTPETVGVFLLAVVGVTQVAYRIFRGVGVTNRWLESLLSWRSTDRVKC